MTLTDLYYFFGLIIIAIYIYIEVISKPIEQYTQLDDLRVYLRNLFKQSRTKITFILGIHLIIGLFLPECIFIYGIIISNAITALIIINLNDQKSKFFEVVSYIITLSLFTCAAYYHFTNH